MRALEILEEVSLFSDLTMDELVLIAPLCKVIEGRAGDFIIQEGERVQNVYILLSGDATIKKAKADGKLVQIDQVKKDDLLGEVTFFKNTPASATVVANSSFKALELGHKELHRLLDEHPELGLKIYKKFARVLSMRIKKILARLVEYLPGA